MIAASTSTFLSSSSVFLRAIFARSSLCMISEAIFSSSIRFLSSSSSSSFFRASLISSSFLICSISMARSSLFLTSIILNASRATSMASSSSFFVAALILSSLNLSISFSFCTATALALSANLESILLCASAITKFSSILSCSSFSAFSLLICSTRSATCSSLEGFITATSLSLLSLRVSSSAEDENDF